jgi:hypothetical protein
MACITVKGKQFRHQFVYDGPGDGVHCVFCQYQRPTRAEIDEEFEAENRWREVSESIRWPE